MNLITNFQDGMSDRNYIDILAPSIYLSPDFDSDQSSAKLYKLLKTEFNLGTSFTIFWSEVRDGGSTVNIELNQLTNKNKN